MTRALETLVECTQMQNDTAIRVLENLHQQAAEAVRLEKKNQIKTTAKNFGINTNDANTLKAKLTPVIPYAWRDIEIKPEELEVKMEASKRFRIMAGAEVAANAKEALRKTPWSEDKNSSFDSQNFKAAYGRYFE